MSFGQYGKNRWLEIIPGLISWLVLAFTILMAVFWPIGAIVFIIIFDLFWTLRVIYFVIHVIAAYRKYRNTVAIDWWSEVCKIEGYREIWQVVMLPTLREEQGIIESSLQAILKSNYSMDRMIIVLGGEEADKENFENIARELKLKYEGEFAHFLVTLHPRGLPGEIPGKGSNLRFMAGKLKELIDTLGLPEDKIIVSAFDVDTLAHPQYYSHLAQLFLTVPNPTRTSYQPVTLFSNNIWGATAPVRVAAFGTTFWILSELVRPERMWTFSSHSMPWKMLLEVGFWEPDLVSEDSRIFMQALLHYDGDYRVTPVYLPVSMDTVVGGNYWESLTALYKQQRRWAWGVEHFPYMVEKFKEHPKMPREIKFKYLFNHLEGMVTWSAAPILIFVLGYAPFIFVGDHNSPLVVNSPYTLEFMMRLATLGVFVTGAMSFLLLPKRPRNRSPLNWVFMLFQWLLLPVTFILFGAFPALDAQTRLMLGKYLGFKVTKKVASSRVNV